MQLARYVGPDDFLLRATWGVSNEQANSQAATRPCSSLVSRSGRWNGAGCKKGLLGSIRCGYYTGDASERGQRRAARARARWRRKCASAASLRIGDECDTLAEGT
jgi:hypothetical protein